MNKLAADRAQGELGRIGSDQAVAAETEAAHLVARVRLLMVISGLTTLLAIAAVVGVIGYRAFRAGESRIAATTEGTIVLPKGAHVIATALADDHIVVTLDIAGATEIRTYDVKTLKQIGRIRFATEP